MNKKIQMIEYISYLLREEALEGVTEEDKELIEYWENSFKQELLDYIKPSGKLTEIGSKILIYMQNQKQQNNKKQFTAKNIAEGLFISSRSVSGAMRKMINDGYIVKCSDKPVAYSLVEDVDNY